MPGVVLGEGLDVRRREVLLRGVCAGGEEPVTAPRAQLYGTWKLKRTPKNAEEKARNWAQQLVEEGWPYDAALRRAQEAYSLRGQAK